MSTYLVIADRTAWSLGLARKLQVLGVRDQRAEFVVIVPSDPAMQANQIEALHVANEAAARARTSLQLEGLTVLDAFAGPMLPRKALEQEMDRGSRSYDGVLVGSTRRNPSLQLQPDLVKQLERRHGIPVQVIALDGAVPTLHHAV